MIAKIKYAEIKNLVPGEIVACLNKLPKWSVRETRVIDLLNEEALQKPIIDAYFRDLSPRGIYMFFDELNIVRYIGQTNQSFYQRLLTQLDTTYYPGYGWNSMFVIMGCRRLNKPHIELTEADHEYDFEKACDWKLLIMDVGNAAEMSANQLKKLERILLKTYREYQEEHTLLNSRIGWLYPQDWTTPLTALMDR